MATVLCVMAKNGRYILIIEDADRLQQVIRKPVHRVLWLLCILAIAVLIMALGWLIGYRQGGGGKYLDARQRGDFTDMMMRIDSLRHNAEINQHYINNVLGLFDNNRIATSDSVAAGRPVSSLSPDSLMAATEQERRFNASWERDRNYRVSALASMAAEGVRFGPVATAGITTHNSMKNEEVEIIVPIGDPVLTPADARVIDLYYSGLKGGFTLLLQHPRGFLSRISGLGKVLVHEGATLAQGDAIGFGPGRNVGSNASVRVRIWHNGSPLLPSQYLTLPPYNSKK